MRKDTRAALQRLSATGRVSSQPVFQDLRLELELQRRKGSERVIHADFSNIELRILAQSGFCFASLVPKEKRFSDVFIIDEEVNNGN